MKFPGRQYTAIPSGTLFYIAWRNLVSKKLRTFLTIFGIIIGIGAIFFLLSFGLGLQNLVTKQVIGDKSIKAIDISTPNSKILQLNAEAVNKIRKLPHIDKVGTSFSFPGSLGWKSSEIDSVVYGIEKNYESLSNLNLIYGRLLNDQDTTNVIVNTTALTSIGIKDHKGALNKQLRVRIPLADSSTGKTEIVNSFTIVGIINSGAGSEVFIPNGLFEGAGITHYTQVKATADDTLNVNVLRKQIESMGFQTSSPVDTLDQINKIFKFFNLMLVSFGAIGMIVSVLGMFNTLTISLLERTKEIGLMMALGGRNSDMRKLFVFEAVMLSLLGSMVGIGFAMLGGQVVTMSMNRFAQGRGVKESFALFSAPWWLILGLILFMVMIGLLVVYFPARRAEKINPIDALRRE